jgi:hypothetical protein
MAVLKFRLLDIATTVPFNDSGGPVFRWTRQSSNESGV